MSGLEIITFISALTLFLLIIPLICVYYILRTTMYSIKAILFEK